MGFLALFNAYAMRVCLSIAITEMVLPENKTVTSTEGLCPADNIASNSTPSSGGTYRWNEETQVSG